MRKCMQHNKLVKIQSMNKHFFLYLKHTYGFLTIFKVLLNHRLRFFCSHFSYTGSKVCRVSVPSKNSVSGERATLVVTFSLEGGCCSGMPGSGSVSQLLSTKGTKQVSSFFLSYSSELISGTFCFSGTSSSTGLFSGLSLRANKNLLNRNIDNKKIKE